VEHKVAVREGPSLGVLAGEPDVDVLGEQRGEGERLGVAELDPALVHRVDALREGLAELAVDREAVRDAEQLLVERADLLLRYRRVDARASGPIELAGAGGGRVLELAGVDLPAELVVHRLQSGSPCLLLILDFVRGDDALLDQLLGVELADRRVLLDLRRHYRLRVGGLIGLVVAEAPVPDQVDDHVPAPALAVGHR
jgi:hypothetical protein